MEFLHHLLSAENDSVFVYNFFTSAINDNVFDNPVLFKNVENFFLTDIMMHNQLDLAGKFDISYCVFRSLGL